jgi:hypothetical protein
MQGKASVLICLGTGFEKGLMRASACLSAATWRGLKAE